MTQMTLNFSDSMAEKIQQQAKNLQLPPEVIIEQWSEAADKEASRKALEAFDQLCLEAEASGAADMSLDEINVLITQSRAERKARG